MNKIDINTLTKEELIKVLGNVGDIIQTESDWIGYGCGAADAKILNAVTSACTEYCSKNNTFDLTDIKLVEIVTKPTGSLMKVNAGEIAKNMPKFQLPFLSATSVLEKYQDKQDWVVSKKTMTEKDEYFIFDKGLTRDQVRSKYSSLTKAPFTDVRSCRIENHGK